MRKTIEVETIREWVNTRLATPNSSTWVGDLTPEQAFRLGAASLLEQILLATGNYRGFRYLTGHTENGTHYGDDTARHYFGGPK